MKKVIIHTNLHERCGNAEYARDLQKQLSQWYEVSCTDQHDLSNADIVIINWCSGRVVLRYEMIQECRDRGQIVLVIWQQSLAEAWEAGHALCAASAVTAHEPMVVSNLKVHYIPMGIPIVDVPDFKSDGQLRIGTAGFPFLWKRYDVVAEAARKFNAKLIMFGPKNEHFDAGEYLNGIAGHLGGNAEIVQDWLPVEQIVQTLATCDVNIFWFESQKDEDQCGQSASVRMGIAAKRPTIISGHRKFRTLLPYGAAPNPELYVAWEEPAVYEFITEILAHPERARRPKRLLAEQGWPATGLMYRNLIEEISKNEKVENDSIENDEARGLRALGS